MLLTKDEEKEKVLFDTFFTGKHLRDIEPDHMEDTSTEIKYNRILSDDNMDMPDYEYDSEITMEELEWAIEKQEIADKCTDRDNIHPILLKKLGNSGKQILLRIFNLCLENKIWLWDCSGISFIRKGGKSTYSQAGSYRPITIASYFGKILERIVAGRISDHIRSQGELDDEQEGFQQGRSTTRYLYRLLANIGEVKRKRMTCMLLFLDFEKAFDSVYIPKLIIKLSNLGIKGNLLSLINEFLVNRKVSLRVNKYYGPIRNCNLFGLPQGSTISPLLFIIYISDMSKSIPEELRFIISLYKFADDGTIMVYEENLRQCHHLLQQVCDSLSTWCKNNKLVINCNVNKTEVVVLNTMSEQNDIQSLPNIKINGKEIRYVSFSKVLGLVIDEKLSFQEHASQKLKECKQKWGILTRSTNRCQGLNVRSLTLLLKTIILTKLLYAAPIWLKNQLKTFNSFWNDIVLKCSGSTLYPHRDFTELTIQLPPLEVQLETLTLKFLCKSMTYRDFMTSIIIQIDNSLSHELKPHLKILKDFIASKMGIRTARHIDLLDENIKEHAFYNKEEIEKFMFNRWLIKIKNRCQAGRRSSDKDELLMKIISRLQSNETLSRKTIKDHWIFNNNTTRRSDSYLLDFLHGNSLIFGNVRKRVNDQETDTCQFCKKQQDSAVHQLFYCGYLEDETREELMDKIQNLESYQEDILFPEDKQILYAFIRRIAYIEEKHESFQEEP